MPLQGTAENQGTGTAIVVTPSGSASGRVAVVILAVKGGSNVAFVAGTGIPSGWSQTGTPRVNNGTNIAYIPFWKVLGGSEPGTYTWTLTTSRAYAVQIRIYSGISTTEAIAAAAGQANGSSANSTAPSLTLPTAGMEVIYASALNRGITGGAAHTPPSGWANEEETAGGSGTSFVSLSTSDATVAASGATGTKVGIWTTADLNIGAMIALTPASATRERTATPVTAAIQATEARTATPVTAAISETLARTATPATAAIQTDEARTATPVTAAIQAAEARTATPVTAAIEATEARTATPATAAIQTTEARTATPITAALQVAEERTATGITASIDVPGGATTVELTATPVTAAIQTVEARTATPATAAIQTTEARTATPITAAVQAAEARTASPVTAAIQEALARTAASVTAAISEALTRTASPITAALQVSEARTATGITASIDIGAAVVPADIGTVPGGSRLVGSGAGGSRSGSVGGGSRQTR